jgi:hypothetical protein
MIKHGWLVFADFTNFNVTVLKGQGTPFTPRLNQSGFLHAGFAKKLVLPTLAKPASGGHMSHEHG